MNSRNLVAVVVTLLVVFAAGVSRGAEFESRFAQRAERKYMEELEDAAEAYKRSLEDAKDWVMRDGDLAEANRIDAEIKKMKREIRKLEEWPKLEKTTWDMQYELWPKGKIIRREFWSDGRVFDAQAYERMERVPESGAGWRSYFENRIEKIQFYPIEGHFLDTYILSEDGRSLEGKNTLGKRVWAKRVGEPVFEMRKPVR